MLRKLEQLKSLYKSSSTPYLRFKTIAYLASYISTGIIIAFLLVVSQYRQCKSMANSLKYSLRDEIIDAIKLKDLKNAVQIRCDTSETLPLPLFIETVQQAPVAISITDEKANILYINKEFSRVTGYSASEIIGENESKLSAKSTPHAVYRYLWQTISHKETWRGQLINRHKNGQLYLVDLTVSPMLNDRGAITHYIGLHRDITQLHQSEQIVNNQKKLIEALVNTSPVAMVVLDTNYKIILDNQKYKMLISELGLREPALYFVDALQKDLGNLWASKGSFNHREIRFDRAEHTPRWFSCSGSWFNENDTGIGSYFSRESKSYLLLSLNDTTLQRRYQDKLNLQTFVENSENGAGRNEDF